MKGLIFTNFLEMVSEKFSPEMVEKIIDASQLKNEGAYTEIGTYPYEEMVELITHLSEMTNISISDLQIAYGKYLFPRLKDRYAKFVTQTKSTFEFLQYVDTHVYAEVQKLYPESEHPHFECMTINPCCITLKYQSNRPFAKIAEGIMLGCATYFEENIQITSQDLGSSPEGKNNVLFTLTKKG